MASLRCSAFLAVLDEQETVERLYPALVPPCRLELPSLKYNDVTAYVELDALEQSLANQRLSAWLSKARTLGLAAARAQEVVESGSEPSEHRR